MTSMRPRTVIIAGGAGDVGVGIVRAFRSAAYSVIIPSRSPEKLEALQTAVGDGLDLVETDLSDPVAATQFAEEIAKRHGGVDAVIAALGGWTATGSLLDIHPESWSHVLQNNLTSHVLTAQALAPLLATTRGTYLMINGGAADKPVLGYGPVSIAAAAQVMMMRVLDQELAPSGAKALTLLIDSIINTRARSNPKPEWITADEVGRLAVMLVSPLGESMGGQVVRAGSLRRSNI